MIVGFDTSFFDRLLRLGSTVAFEIQVLRVLPLQDLKDLLKSQKTGKEDKKQEGVK